MNLLVSPGAKPAKLIEDGEKTAAIINWAFNSKIPVLVEDDKGNLSTEITPQNIILVHELIHAYRIFTGKWLNEIPKNRECYDTKNEDGTNLPLFQFQEELQTTGLGNDLNKQNLKFTENAFRKEHKLKKRVRYETRAEAKDGDSNAPR